MTAFIVIPQISVRRGNKLWWFSCFVTQQTLCSLLCSLLTRERQVQFQSWGSLFNFRSQTKSKENNYSPYCMNSSVNNFIISFSYYVCCDWSIRRTILYIFLELLCPKCMLIHHQVFLWLEMYERILVFPIRFMFRGVSCPAGCPARDVFGP